MTSHVKHSTKIHIAPGRGATRGTDKGTEAPPLAKSKSRKKIKISDCFDFFCVLVI